MISVINRLDIKSREEFREWLFLNADKEPECWVCVKKGKPTAEENLWYIDAVEEAICFGWIDSTFKIIDGKSMQRFSPRRKNSFWTELNKERARRLEKLGLMTESGRSVLPKMGPRSFIIDEDLKNRLKKARAWSKFKRFPTLYQRVRSQNVSGLKNRNIDENERAVSRLIEMTRKEKMYGSWNDYGRLIDY